jgi:hypothetical protein
MGKKSMAVVAIVLAAFFVLGFVHGRSDANQPDALLQSAVRHSHFALDDKKRVDLIYSCDSDIYVWDISAKQYSITPQEARRRLDSGLGQPKVPVTSQRIAVMTGSLGGIVAAWSLKDGVKAIQEGDSKQARLIVATVIAAISGYGGGYALGIHSLPACNSDVMLSMLDDSISPTSQPGSANILWKKMEKLAFEAKTLELFSLCDFIEDKQVRESQKGALAFLYRTTMQPNHELGQLDLRLLLGGETAIRAKTKEHRITTTEKILKALLWLPWILLIGCLMAIYAPKVVKSLRLRIHPPPVQPVA